MLKNPLKTSNILLLTQSENEVFSYLCKSD